MPVLLEHIKQILGVAYVLHVMLEHIRPILGLAYALHVMLGPTGYELGRLHRVTARIVLLGPFEVLLEVPRLLIAPHAMLGPTGRRQSRPRRLLRALGLAAAASGALPALPRQVHALVALS